MSILRSGFLFVFLLPLYIYAQPAVVGVHLDSPQEGNFVLTKADLPVNFFLIDGILPVNTVRELNTKGKSLWVSSGLEFPRRYDLKKYADSLFTSITDPLIYYRRAGISINTYILASHPQAAEPVLNFLQEIIDSNSLVNDSRKALITTPGSAYRFESNPVSLILAIDEMSDFFSASEAATVYILPPTLGDSAARNLRTILQESIIRGQEVIIPISYLNELQANDKRILPLIAEFTGSSNPVFALTESDESRSSFSITILALISCWMIFGMFFFSNGAYHNGLNRYLFTHNLYVNDVINRRLKAEQDIVIAILIVSIFSGLFLMIFMQAMNTYLINSLLHVHLPTLSTYLYSETWVFTIGSAGMLLFIALATFWIYIANYARVSFGQILQLFIYPLHIVVAAATVMAVLQLNNAHGVLHLIISAITLVIILSSFYLANGDIAPYNQQRRTGSIIMGPLFYSCSLLGAAVLIWMYTPAYDMLLLLIQLLD